MSTPNVDGNSHQVNPLSDQGATNGTGDVWGEESEGFENGKRAVAETSARLEAQREADEQAGSAIRQERDIVKRARALLSAGIIQFPDVTFIQAVSKAKKTDQNKCAILDALFADEDGPMPHLDHFRGRIVDHEDELIDEFYPVTRWVRVFAAAGLKEVSLDDARKVLKEWALDHKRNDLIRRIEQEIPAWDGKPRLETKLIDLFQCNDTELNRMFGKYFWLSLFSRVMMPGSLAPMVLSLFGAQGCGKSLFQKKLAQIITGNENADSVQLNLDGDRLEFLRSITGQSVIASVGEMTGLVRGDLNKIKDFITRQQDQMHYKFEGNFSQARQWITIMDGNKYEGLQRDDTGNRRFYPMFCGQTDDVGGQPAFRADFEAVFDDPVRGISFESDVWQLLAEAQAWFEENGEDGYSTYVREVVRRVNDFNKAEMAAERGVVVDGDIETYLAAALAKVELEIIPMRDGSGKTCVRVDRVELLAVAHKLSNGKARFHPNGLKKAMDARGAELVKPNGIAKYRFSACANASEFKAMLATRGYTADDESDVQIVEQEF